MQEFTDEPGTPIEGRTPGVESELRDLVERHAARQGGSRGFAEGTQALLTFLLTGGPGLAAELSNIWAKYRQ